ncbi:helix-turn-helix transcriptional regulator [Streptomyces sp. NPDC057740]|uniref:helix-turn-helix transcriptional regulator n=1 Tax=Streptomyces sp. NPDC057740 TaxID=3346234 RepID=UPI00367ED918
MEHFDQAAMADFLRRRREALQPHDVGLPKGTRRRATGLRREEVAVLAGMSTDYLARLEQQRGPRPSEQLLAALARALRLSLDERDHLFRLAGHGVPARVRREEHVSPGLMRVLDRLEDTPAQVISDLAETLVQNRLATALLGDETRYTGMARSGFYRWFTDPRARGRYAQADHALQSRTHVAGLRAALSRGADDPRLVAMVDDLCRRSAEFRELWDLHEVAVQVGQRKTLLHPEVGALRLDCQVLFTENQAQALLVFTATPGSEDQEKLQLLNVLTHGRISA